MFWCTFSFVSVVQHKPLAEVKLGQIWKSGKLCVGIAPRTSGSTDFVLTQNLKKLICFP